jgi:hypothetical protein
VTKRRFFVGVAVLALTAVTVVGQSKPSIQGVWKPVEVTITAPTPQLGGLPKGTHTNLQPGLVVFTATHYALLIDSSAKPRPELPAGDASTQTKEMLQASWGPFAANAGTYEIAGTTLTTHPVVAKNPSNQTGKTFARYSIKFDGNYLWATQVESAAGKVANPITTKYVRVE